MDPSSFLFIFLVTTGVSLLGLAGGLLILWRERAARRLAHYLMSFAAGSMLAAAFLDLIPEALELTATDSGKPTNILWYVLVGILVFFAIEKLLVWHHHTHEHDEETDGHHPSHFPQRIALRPLIILGDGLHNFLDGVIVAVTFLIDPALGWITSAAVIAHELPQEIGDFSILLNAGMKRSRVLLWNVVGALFGAIGAVIGYFAHGSFEHIEAPLVAFAAGNFIYIALADLFPSIQHERRFVSSLAHIALVIGGLVMLWSVGTLFPHTA